MRKVLLLAATLFACSTNDEAKIDSAAATTDAPARLTAADVAGTWTGTTMMEGTDSVTSRFTLLRDSDTEGKLVFENSTDTVRYSVVYDADSMIATSRPFKSTAEPKLDVMFRSIGRLKDGKLVGTSTRALAAKPDSVISRARWEATRKP